MEFYSSEFDLNELNRNLHLSRDISATPHFLSKSYCSIKITKDQTVKKNTKFIVGSISLTKEPRKLTIERCLEIFKIHAPLEIPIAVSGSCLWTADKIFGVNWSRIRVRRKHVLKWLNMPATSACLTSTLYPKTRNEFLWFLFFTWPLLRATFVRLADIQFIASYENRFTLINNQNDVRATRFERNPVY